LALEKGLETQTGIRGFNIFGFGEKLRALTPLLSKRGKKVVLKRGYFTRGNYP